MHRWREGLIGYVSQQYGFGYGRVDLVAKHPSRAGGDSVSPAGMMLQPMLTAAALAAMMLATLGWSAGAPWRTSAAIGAALLGTVIFERIAAGVAAARRFGSLTPLVFPLLHLARNAAWVAAVGVWVARRVTGRRSSPAHSMRPRPEIGR